MYMYMYNNGRRITFPAVTFEVDCMPTITHNLSTYRSTTYMYMHKHVYKCRTSYVHGSAILGSWLG